MDGLQEICDTALDWIRDSRADGNKWADLRVILIKSKRDMG